MTITSLRLDHSLNSTSVEQADRSVKISIQYSIDVLEELRRDGFIGVRARARLDAMLRKKIAELQSLIK